MSLPFNTDTSVQLPLAFNTNNSYNPIITSNNISSYSGWTTTGGIVYNTPVSSYVGIGLTDPKTFLEITDTINKLKIGSRTDAGYISTNHIICNTFMRFMSANPTTIAYFGYITNYELMTVAERVMILEITRTALNMTGDIYASGNFGVGVAPSALFKCNIAGSINSTALYQSGTLIDFSSYATNTN